MLDQHVEKTVSICVSGYDLLDVGFQPALKTMERIGSKGVLKGIFNETLTLVGSMDGQSGLVSSLLFQSG